MAKKGRGEGTDTLVDGPEAQIGLSAHGDAENAIVDTAHEAFVGMDEHGVITAWNPAAETTFGWTADEAKGRMVADTIIPAELRHQHLRGLAHLIATGEGPVLGQRLELSALHRDGHEFPVEITISSVRRSDGWSFYAFLHDISDRKRAEEERDRAERVKDEFLGVISHEMRTPLTAVIGYADMLAKTEAENLSERGRQMVEVINRSAERQMRLLRDLLLLARIESGSFELRPEPLDLTELARQATEIAEPAAEAAGLDLQLRTDGALSLSGDRDRIGQAIDNLLTNAIKFTPEGGSVAVRVDADGDRALIEVEDSGTGIPLDEQDRLFERSYRASGATERNIPGSGLGLTIVKEIVEAHGGSASFQSEPGRGSTFRLELPLGSV
jgi:PAS domain S-box-containing protein